MSEIQRAMEAVVRASSVPGLTWEAQRKLLAAYDRLVDARREFNAGRRERT